MFCPRVNRRAGGTRNGKLTCIELVVLARVDKADGPLLARQREKLLPPRLGRCSCVSAVPRVRTTYLS